MIEAKLVRDMSFPAQRVWAVLEDYGNMAWTGAPEFNVIGEGIGMIRQVIMPGLDPIDEVLEMMDRENMTFSYSIPRGLPLPLTDYRSTAALERLGDNNTRIYWSCQCTPTDDSMTDADVEKLMQGVYSDLLDSLEAYLGKEE
jgi:hypothetical protein